MTEVSQLLNSFCLWSNPGLGANDLISSQRCRKALGHLSNYRLLFLMHFFKNNTFPDSISLQTLIQQQINEDKQNLREKTVYGIQLTEEKLNDFRDEQIGQLKELMDEATKPNKKITISKDLKHKN
uniref:Uncharacterized protein n=1 Tax=Bubo bubo TaxID=30461 RepID=A0A8C0FE66_BUBBB